MGGDGTEGEEIRRAISFFGKVFEVSTALMKRLLKMLVETIKGPIWLMGHTIKTRDQKKKVGGGGAWQNNRGWTIQKKVKSNNSNGVYRLQNTTFYLVR